MASAPLTVAIAGVGVMGRDHLQNALELQREGLLRVVGLADVAHERARQLGEPHGIPAFAEFGMLFDAVRPDFVIVATPHPAHEAITLAAAARGVHVLCEKPIASAVSVADRMVEACRRAGVLLGIDFNQRTNPTYVRARDLIAGGEIGELYRVSFVASGWYRTQAYYDSGGWRGTWLGEGGGVIMNQAPHHLDLYCWLGGFPQRIKATALTREHQIEVENTIAALLEHGAGRVDSYYTTTAEWPGRTEIVLTGQTGQLVIAGRALRLYRMARSLAVELQTSPHGTLPSGDWEDVPVEDADVKIEHTAVLRRFAQAVRSGSEEELVATGEDGRRALELANGMLLSAFADRTVHLPLDRVAYDAFLEEMQRRAAAGELRQKRASAASDQVLASLPSTS
jgi:predicted dehydrogenase